MSVMIDILAVILFVLWVGCNVYLWSMKQSVLTLFWESIGLAAIAYPTLWLYVNRDPQD